ncbi:MAG: class I SAM-dependent methyltransferase [Opitutaceae bacterium]|jgi:SAM-dependent methyltransferase
MPKADLNPLGRFSDRVEDYVRYRPSYPLSLVDFLRRNAGLEAGASVADVGSGTGILTRLLLDAGARVHAVEPNDAMRRAAESEFGDRSGFVSVNGTAEKTGLPSAVVSLITCAQAFHWFEPGETRVEFARILRPGGRCAIIWNNSAAHDSAFASGYEAIRSRFRTDSGRVHHENIRAMEEFDAFFGRGNWQRHSFGNFQVLDRIGLRGRMLSASYAPKPGHPAYESMIAALDELFERCQSNGTVRMDYNTELFLGAFPSPAA